MNEPSKSFGDVYKTQIAELERLRASLHWIRNEATFALQKFPGDVTAYRESLLDISKRARASLEPADALGSIAADANVDPSFRRILSGGLSDYGREEHDLDTFGRPLRSGT